MNFRVPVSPCSKAVFLCVLFCNSLPAMQAVTSSFDNDLDGWTVENNGTPNGASHVSVGGNPGGYMEVRDRMVGTYRNVAPAKFLGDLTAFDGGIVSIDMIVWPDGPLTTQVGKVQISNTSAGLSGVIDAAPNGISTSWERYRMRFDAVTAQMSQMDWMTLLSAVDKIVVSMDASGGLERTGMDNFGLYACRNPVLFPPNPGTAGVENELQVFCATPGGTVWFFYSNALGQSAPAGICPQLMLGLAKAKVGGVQSAKPTGDALLRRFVPLKASNKTFYVQAVDQASCRKTNIVRQTF